MNGGLGISVDISGNLVGSLIYLCGALHHCAVKHGGLPLHNVVMPPVGKVDAVLP